MTSSGESEFVLSNQSELWFQISVIQFLQKMGFVFLPENELGIVHPTDIRGMLLKGTLREQLERINRLEFKGHSQSVNEQRIRESICLMLSAGRSVDGMASQRVLNCVLASRKQESPEGGGDFHDGLKFVDWENPHSNTFHIAANFLRNEKQAREIVCFVNGIPLVLIDCSRNHEAFLGDRSKRIRGQSVSPGKSSDRFLQLVFALGRNRGFFGAVSEPSYTWHEWRPGEGCHADLTELIRSPPKDEHQECLFRGEFAFARVDFERDKRLTPEARGFERILWELFQPTRLLDLLGKYLVRDETFGQGIVASQSEILAVTKTMRRMGRRKRRNGRQGGFLWLPIGERMPLLLAFLVRSLSSTAPQSQKKLLLIDCGDRGKNGERGRLMGVLRGIGEGGCVLRSSSEFCVGLEEKRLLVSSMNLLLVALASESSGIELGLSHERLVVVSFCPKEMTIEQVETLQGIFPGWCFLFVSERAPSKEWKRAMRQFGGMIDSGYTYAQSIGEGALVPSYYESRLLRVPLREPQGDSIDASSISIVEPLKLSSDDALDMSGDARFLGRHLKCIASDVSQDCNSGGGAILGCGLVVVATMAEALMLKAFMDEIGGIVCRLGIPVSGGEQSSEQKRAYNWGTATSRIGARVGSVTEAEVVVVTVEQLDYLDDSRVTVLYLATQLSGSELLGAICTVSRPRYEKDFSVVVGYEVPKELSTGYRSAVAALSGIYGRRCIDGLCHDLPRALISLPDQLKSVREFIPLDHNEPGRRRGAGSLDDAFCCARFFREFLQFHRRLLLATVSLHWRERTPISTKNSYGQALMKLQRLRWIAGLRFSVALDHLEFEPQLRQLINMVGEGEPSLGLPANLNSFDQIQFEAALACMPSARARVDMIAHWMLKELSERSIGAPEFYESSKTELMSWIRNCQSNRRGGRAYGNCLRWALKQAQAAQLFGSRDLTTVGSSSELFRDAVNRTIGPKLPMNENQEALVLSEVGHTYALNESVRPQVDPLILLLVDQLESLVNQHRTVVWKVNSDRQNQLRNDLDDCLLKFQARENLRISVQEMDLLIDAALKLAS